MANPTNKEELLKAASDNYQELMNLIESASLEVLEKDFPPLSPSAKCTSFEQGNNLRDILTHIYEWQRLQSQFVKNIRNGEPKDFIPDPYRKDYKEMDRKNMERHQSTPVKEAISMIQESHQEMMQLIATFSNEELFGKKVYKVTYTTTMAAYFVSVTSHPYSKAVKRLKAHLKKNK